MSFPRYPSYKDSGAKWLGEVPSHWGVKPMWTFFRRVKRVGFESELLLSVYRDYGVIPKASRDDNFNKPSDDLSVYQLVVPGDLAINKMKAWQGSVAVSDCRGIVSPAYFIYEALHDSNRRFLHHLFRSPRYIGGYLSHSKGIRPNQWDLEPEVHSRFPVLVPPAAEQTAIAKFLDGETGKIDALVAEQRRLMELLKEKRQAVISHAVTRGLNPKAKLKPSGIDWIGDLPVHWSAQPLFLRYQAVLGKMVDEKQKTGEHPVSYLRNADVNWDRINITDLPTFDVTPEEEERCLLRAGDLLICEGGAGVGQTSIWQGELERCAFQKALHRLRPWSNNEIPRFLYYCMRYAVESGVVLAGGTATIPHLTGEQLRRYRFPCPPAEEQQQIVAFLDCEAEKFDTLTAEAQRAIDLLQERRTALISAAVTGQIDVRADDPDDFAIVLRLPPVAAEPPLLENRINGVPEMQRFWETCDPMDLPENPDVVVVMDWLNRMAEVGGFERSLEHLGLTHQDVVDQVLQPAENDNLKPLRAAHPLVLMQCLWRIGVQYERNGYDDMRRPILSEKPAAAGEFWRELRKKLVRGQERPCLMFATAGR